MTLGEKIKKYRLLRNMTQNELGMKLGFSASTADSRIRKYESNQMAPKADKRALLADALNIDISALSDNEISSNADVMRTLFEFEDRLDMDIKLMDGKTHLIFDNANSNIEQLISYLYLWNNKKQQLSLSDANSIHDYEDWKARFPINLFEYLDSQKQKITDYYAPLSAECSKSIMPITTRTDFVVLLRKMLQAGITLSARLSHTKPSTGTLVLSFSIFELLNPTSSEAKNLFATFSCCLDTFMKYGMEISTDVITLSSGNKLCYTFHLPELMNCASLVQELTEFESKKETLDDWSIETFDQKFTASLEDHNFNFIEILNKNAE